MLIQIFPSETSSIFTPLLTAALGAGVGALSAFGLNLWLNHIATTARNRMNIAYNISSLSALLNILFNYKKSVLVPRENEIQKNEQVLSHNDGGVELLFDECSKFILHQDITLSIRLSELAFLSENNPNILSILQQLESSITQLNVIINQYNDYLKYVHGDYKDKNMENNDAIFHFRMIKEMIDHFRKQIDSTLYFALKSLELLLQYSKLEYRKFNIKNADFSSYKDYLPKKKKDWEEISYFGKKQARMKGILEYFK